MNYSSDFVQDGAGANNREWGGAAGLQGLDSIGEVRVETSSSSARYSRPASVIVTTKSGGNAIHGALYETVRNNAFGVARARQDVTLTAVLRHLAYRNEFGGSITVFLPPSGSTAGARYHLLLHLPAAPKPPGGLPTTVNTPPMRTGNFVFPDNQGRAITLTIHSTRPTTTNGHLATRTPPRQRSSHVASTPERIYESRS
jgi:hypothetical protein